MRARARRSDAHAELARRGSMLPRRAMAVALTLALTAMWSPPRLAAPATGGHVTVTARKPRGRRLSGKSTTTTTTASLGCGSKPNNIRGATAAAGGGSKMEAAAAAGLRASFLDVLLSRRRNLQVPLTVEPGSPVKRPLYQGRPPMGRSEAMESCPRKGVVNSKEKLVEENFYLITEALKSAWRNGDAMPFILDTVWDLIKLGDHLIEREDVDPCRIGITGESLGGMHAWFAAFVDTRYSVVVPIIGVQGFRWAIDNNKWQARVDSIKPLFEEARIDLGKSEIDTEVVEKVWDKIAPGLDSQFDASFSLPVIAPRPLLLLNGAEDPRCPVLGLQEPVSRAAKAYEEVGSADKFMFIAEPGIGHQMTANMVKEASDWFDRFL
uniref:Peptidase S9 prolyl oligopeptidase catalytic domain-containing protein n=1 Tax=Oryza meridionalis TaxID=40149 RepID=A0A0E0DXE6_9ORYZ